MVTPLMQEGSIGSRSRREKEQFSKMLTEGPLDASLMLKIPNAPSCKLRYCLGVGKEQTGPHEFDFSETAIDKRGSFGINWLLELEKDGSIIVSVEMLPPTEVHQRPAMQDDELTPLQDNTQSVPPGSPPSKEAEIDGSGMKMHDTPAQAHVAPELEQDSIDGHAHLGVGADASAATQDEGTTRLLACNLGPPPGLPPPTAQQIVLTTG